MRFLLIILLAWPNIALAQNHFCGKQFVTGATGAIEYPLNRSGVFNTAGAEYYFDFSQDPSSSPVTDGTGSYQFAVSGSPVRRGDGTWPAGLGGSEGQAWYSSNTPGLSRAHDGSLDMTTKFTLAAVQTVMSVSGIFYLSEKRTTSPDMGYRFYSFDDDTYLQTYNTTGTDMVMSDALSVGGINCVVATLDGTGGAGASDGALYMDEYTAVTSSALNNVPANTGDTKITLDNSVHKGIHYIAYYSDVVWPEAQARAFCRKFFGLYADDGQSYVSVTSASPAATFLTDSGEPNYLAQTSPDNAIVGRYGLYAHPAIDNLIQRSSFETWPTWDETETAGDGSASIDGVVNRTAAHGQRHISMTLTGTTSEAIAASACVTSGIAADLYVQAQLKKTSGTTQAAVRIHEFSDASCGTSLGTTDIVAATDVTSSWAEYGGLFAAASWNGSTSSWEIELVETCNGGCVSHWDAIQAASRSVPTDSYCVTCDTDATCSCTYTAATIPQVLSAQGWKLTAAIRSPIDGASASPVRYIMTVPGTAGNNNRIDIYWASDTLTADVYDSSGTKKTATVAAAGNADTDYAIEVQHTTAGSVTVCWDGSCGTPATGATMDGISATCRLGHNGTSGGDIWIRNLKVEAL